MTHVWTCHSCEASSAGTQVRRANNRATICDWCRAELTRTRRGWCPRCLCAYPLAEMRDGYCRAHKRAMNAAYRATHAERERDRVAAWKAVHRPARPRRTALDSNERQRAYRARKAATDPAYWRNRYLAGKMARWRRAQGRW